MTNVHKALHLVFGIIGNAIGLMVFLSPSVTFKRILSKKSTEQFSGIPYVMALLNCLLAAWYGLPFISPNNMLVTAINGTGAVLESIYILIFLLYAPKREKAKIFGLLICVLAFFSTIALVSSFAIHKKNTKRLLCGFAATAFSIVMYASPLSIMRMVIKTKSVEYMPFFLSLFLFLCGTTWLIYGLLGNDMFLYIPNGLGSFLGAIQLILYAIYRKSKGDVDKIASVNMEMGLEKPYQQKQPNNARNGQS